MIVDRLYMRSMRNNEYSTEACFEAIYIKSYDHNGHEHSNEDWRTIKYRSRVGKLWVLSRNTGKRFQWCPINKETGEVIINKGIISSHIKEYEITCDRLLIQTKHSSYLFFITNHLENSLPPKIW